MARYIDVADITKQIADFKKSVNSPNSDYMTGYLSALSVTEGMIANTPTANVAPIADTIEELKLRIAMRFGTYTDKDMTPITEVFRLLDQISKELKGE